MLLLTLLRRVCLSSLLIGACIAGMSGTAQAADDPQSKPLTAHQILQRTAKVYAECKTYRDEGEKKTVFIDDDGNKRTNVLAFETAFVRPDRFRFEYSVKQGMSKGLRRLLWRHREDVKEWHSPDGKVRSARSLGLAVGGFTGVSGGTAWYVPALLLPQELATWRFTNPEEVQRIEDAKLEKSDCYRLRGKWGFEGRMEAVIWIQKDSLVLRRIEKQHDHGKFRAESTITYLPLINEPVTEAMLAFDPPSENRRK